MIPRARWQQIQSLFEQLIDTGEQILGDLIYRHMTTVPMHQRSRTAGHEARPKTAERAVAHSQELTGLQPVNITRKKLS